MPSFREVGELLKSKYEKPVQVAPKSKKRLRPRDRRKRRMAVSENDLVFKDRSPNFCRPDASRGILGTRGRECKVGGRGGESCDLLCCGRGYNTEVVRYVERCHCKFIWCCEVRCKNLRNPRGPAYLQIVLTSSSDGIDLTSLSDKLRLTSLPGTDIS